MAKKRGGGALAKYPESTNTPTRKTFATVCNSFWHLTQTDFVTTHIMPYYALIIQILSRHHQPTGRWADPAGCYHTRRWLAAVERRHHSWHRGILTQRRLRGWQQSCLLHGAPSGLLAWGGWSRRGRRRRRAIAGRSADATRPFTRRLAGRLRHYPGLLLLCLIRHVYQSGLLWSGQQHCPHQRPPLLWRSWWRGRRFSDNRFPASAVGSPTESILGVLGRAKGP